MLTTSEATHTTSVPGHLSEVSVELSQVSIRYSVSAEAVGSLKEHVLRRLAGRRTERRDFWALRDVDLTVHRGEALGIIGRNGAGKSTLLRVIARVLRPTTGTVWVRGNLAPLLELGAGLHPELTGRENIFLKGSLLGFSRSAMEDKVEDIIEFSELETFIDVPLRTYSSGMITRLGFAIATSVNPDILLIDEVLAVGDKAFQEKAFARMTQFLGRNITILFVSHALGAIRDICDRAIWIDEGHIRGSGPTQEIIKAYRDQLRDRP